MPAALILIADGTEEMELYALFFLLFFCLKNIYKSTIESTITYDTLVRAGVNTTSAFVPDIFSPRGAESRVNPLAAKGSRGINILPDIYLELSLCGPVSLRHPPFSSLPSIMRAGCL
jgi:protein DJ-1